MSQNINEHLLYYSLVELLDAISRDMSSKNPAMKHSQT